MPVFEHRALEAELRKLQRPLGEKAMTNELLHEAASQAAGPKTVRPDQPLYRGASTPRPRLQITRRVCRKNTRGHVCHSGKHDIWSPLCGA